MDLILGWRLGRIISPLPLSSFNKSYYVTFPGKYSLLFANCNDLSLVTMDVRTELANYGATTNYLSADQRQPSFYFNFFLVYLCFLGVWISLCFKNLQYFQRIHLLMGLLLVMTLFQFYYARADQQDLKVTGTHDKGWNVKVYESRLLRNMLFFTVMVLIGAGRCIRKPKLTIFTLAIVILVHVWATVSFGPWFWFIDMICVLVVFFHNIRSVPPKFKLALDASSFVGFLKNTSVRPAVLTLLFWVLYTPFKVIGETGDLVSETVVLVFYMALFYMFRPFNLEEKNWCG